MRREETAVEKLYREYGIRYDDDWVTINGTHVLIDENGNAQGGGKLKGMNFKDANSTKKSSGQSKKQERHYAFHDDPKLFQRSKAGTKARKSYKNKIHRDYLGKFDELKAQGASAEELGKARREYKDELDAFNAEIMKMYPTPDDVKSVEEAQEYLSACGILGKVDPEETEDSAFYGIPTGYASLEWMQSAGSAKSMCKVADAVMQRFPKVSGLVHSLSADSYHASDNVAGYADESGNVVLNTRVVDKPTTARDARDAGYHPHYETKSKFAQTEATMTHELGHILDYYLTSAAPDLAADVAYDRGDWRSGQGATKYKSVSTAILKKAAENLDIPDYDLQRKISQYSCKNDMEALAEAFSEAMVSERPSAVSREIMRQIESVYNTGKLAEKETQGSDDPDDDIPAF